jgi:hypothetical protein
MLDVIGTSADGSKTIDWHQTWRVSQEFQSMKEELSRLKSLPKISINKSDLAAVGDRSQHQEFVASFPTQFRAVLIRTAKHFWRSPTYIWSKIALVFISVSVLPSLFPRTKPEVYTDFVACSRCISASALMPPIVYKVYKINSMLFSCFLLCSMALMSKSCRCSYHNVLSMRLGNDLPRFINGTVSPCTSNHYI